MLSSLSAFSDLLFLHLVIFFYYLVHVTFLAAGACLSRNLPSITEQQEEEDEDFGHLVAFWFAWYFCDAFSH